jgi:Putative addiction module component
MLTLEQLISEATALPDEGKAILIDKIVESMAGEIDRDILVAGVQKAQERLAEIDSGAAQKKIKKPFELPNAKKMPLNEKKQIASEITELEGYDTQSSEGLKLVEKYSSYEDSVISDIYQKYKQVSVIVSSELSSNSTVEDYRRKFVAYSGVDTIYIPKMYKEALEKIDKRQRKPTE